MTTSESNTYHTEEHANILLEFAHSYADGKLDHMTPWNTWHAEQKRLNPNFRANLQGLYLCNLHLENAIFDDACLANADFRYAHLRNCSFVNADLQKANFQEADLSLVKLQHAKAQSAIFVAANLFQAKLNDGIFDGANFNSSILNETVFSNASMNNTKLLRASIQRARVAGSFSGAKFDYADLTDSDCTCANFPKAILFRAKLKNVNFTLTDLSSCSAYGADISGAEFWYTNLRRADFSYAVVDGFTCVRLSDIDNDTLFTGVGFSSARFQPSLQISLEANIRRKHWDEWYDKKFARVRDMFSPYPDTWYYKYMVPQKPELSKCDNLFDHLYACLAGNYRGGGSVTPWQRCKMAFKVAGNALLNKLVQWFWRASNYGASTRRIVLVFFAFCLLFCLIYMTGFVNLSGLEPFGLGRFLQTLHFATATMVTLGFGGIEVNSVDGSLFWTGFSYFVVTMNLLVGYVLLAALVTRLGILFQQPGP